MLYPETQEERDKLFAEAKAKAKAKKLERMHIMFGPGPVGRQCKDCAHLRRYRQSTTWMKCAIYGEKGTTSTDWRAGWQACGKFEEGK